MVLLLNSRCDQNVRESLFRKDQMHFKRYLFAFLLVKLLFYFLLFVAEAGNHGGAVPFRLFSYWPGSTFQSPSQDKLNREMYRHFKNQVVYSDHQFSTHLLEQGDQSPPFDFSDLGSGGSVVRLSLFKMVLVQLLTFVWKVLTLNFINGNYLLLILEDFILDYHVVEVGLHYFVIVMIFALVFLLRRFVLKKRYPD